MEKMMMLDRENKDNCSEEKHAYFTLVLPHIYIYMLSFNEVALVFFLLYFYSMAASRRQLISATSTSLTSL